MANKKVSQLVSKPSVLVTDLFPIADPTTGQLFKTTISDLGTAIGSGVSSVNTLVGAVVLDTDDIQELASPTNRWFTDTRARAAVSASSPLAYNSGTGVFSIPAATSSQNGYLTSTDWTTFNAKQQALSGTGFVKISGTTISYDNSTYLTTSAAASTYLALAGGTLTGALNGTSANFSSDVFGLTGFYTRNTADTFIGTTNNTSGIKVNGTTLETKIVSGGNVVATFANAGSSVFTNSITASSFIKSGGTSSQFLKADGSVDSSVYALDSAVVKLTGTQTVAGIKTFSNQAVFNSSFMIKNTGSGSVSFGGNTTIWTSDDSFNILVGTAASTTRGFTILYSGINPIMTLPSSDGTLALTSQLSAYLPLAGGTLTGALSGTSASFSGNVVLGTTALSGGGAAQWITANGTSYSGGLIASVSGVAKAYYYYDNGANAAVVQGVAGVGIQLLANNVPALTIASGGAATFSSNSNTTINNTFQNTNTTDTNSRNILNVIAGNVTTSIQSIHNDHSYINATNNIYFQSANSVKMTMTSAGNVGIGTTAPANKLTVAGSSGTIMSLSNGADADLLMNFTSGVTLLTPTTGILAFGTSSTERMRITSGGYLKASNNGSYMSSTSPIHEIRSNANDDWTANISHSATSSPYGISVRFTGASPNGSVNYFLECIDSTASRLRIASNGNVTNTNGSYGTISDARLKENISDATPKLADLLSVKIKNFNLIGEETKQIGVIAQELEAVFPSMVETDIKTGMKQVKTSIFIPMLIKAIQEQQAQIEELKNK